MQIIPSARGIGGSISQAIGGEATSAGKSAGLNIVSALKGVIAAAGIGTFIKQSLDAGGALQQSFGGLDTIYGEAGEAAKAYAKEAAQAGISANDYAEQAVSFGASLKAAFAGDTTKAVEAANTAIMDMADNSAKMGTDIQSIQNAYQGFAKGNYTMLDNLKLGFGGTKTEMQRLLDTASAMPEAMGKTFDINNLGDVYEAIHLIQQDLGLTGVAADEAKTTFTGSMGAMKASLENLMANLALGEDITKPLQTLVGNAQVFLTNNLLPMIANIFKGLPTLLSGLGSAIIRSLNIVSNNAGEIVGFAIDFVSQLASSIIEVAPYLIEAAFELAKALGEAFINTDWMQVGTDLITSIKDSLDLAAGEIFGSDGNIIQALGEAFTSNVAMIGEKGKEIINFLFTGIKEGIPQLAASMSTIMSGLFETFKNSNILQVGVDLINELVNGILSALPELLTAAFDLIFQFADYIIQSAPMLIEAGLDLLINLVHGIIDNLPQIVESAVHILESFCNTIGKNLPMIIEQGILLIGKLIVGIIEAIPKLIAALPKIFNAMKSAFVSFPWKDVGKNILEGIKNGILGAVRMVVDAAKEAAGAIWDAVKGFFEIGSPSKLMAYAGEMIDLGLAGGISDNTGLVNDAVDRLNTSLSSNINPSYEFDNSGASGMDDLISLLGTYLPQIADGGNTNVVLEGDAGRLFRVVQREAARNRQLVGADTVLSM